MRRSILNTSQSRRFLPSTEIYFRLLITVDRFALLRMALKAGGAGFLELAAFLRRDGEFRARFNTVYLVFASILYRSHA